MNIKSSLTLVLDGITVQHAGELLFDWTLTSRQRRECSKTYIRCLEDFSFATLFGSKFALSGSLSTVGQESPGLHLIKAFPEMFHRLDIPGQIRPRDLLEKAASRARIGFDLECLDEALDEGSEYWEQWMIREAVSYLGDHSSLLDATISPEQFVFAINPPYFIDQKLQGKIPPRFIDRLVGVLRTQQELPSVVTPALREFVSRNALTLMTIDLWYEEVFRETFPQDGVRVPHVIRAFVRKTQFKKQQIERNVRDARTMITKLALADALSPPAVLSRDDLINRLGSMRDEWPYPKIRDLLIKLMAELDNTKQSKQAAKLISDIQRLSRTTADTTLDKVIFDVGGSYDPITQKIGGTLKISVPLLKDIPNSVQPTKRALRDLVSRASGAKDYYKKLAGVFPELGLMD